MRVQPEEAIVSQVVGIVPGILDGSFLGSRVSRSRDGWGWYLHRPFCSRASEFCGFANLGVDDLSDSRCLLMINVAQHDRERLPMRAHQFRLLRSNLANMNEERDDINYADTNHAREA